MSLSDDVSISDGSIVLFGAGKMGTALLEGWLAGGIAPERIFIQDPLASDACRALVAARGLSLNKALAEIPAPGLILFAVKPQIMDRLLSDLGDFFGTEALYVSVAAGFTLSGMTKYLGEAVAVVRVMPNMAVAVGHGVAAAFPNEYATREQCALIEDLLRMVGEIVWMSSEDMIDVATAVSGSGPAYVFYLTECLAEAGMAAGLPFEMALRLARLTVEGAGEVLRCAVHSPEELRQNVTSPHGVTAAALAVLREDDALRRLMTQAVNAAVERARQLAG